MAKVWINGRFVGEHSGGYTSFSFNITKFLTEGENSIVLSAFDDVRSGKQPSGKQRRQYITKKGCRYTRTTGIWQTVWLEAVNSKYINVLKMTPDIKNIKLLVEAQLEGDTDNCEVLAKAFYKGKEVGSCKSRATWHSSSFEVGISDLYLWEPGKPELYDLEITLLENDVVLDSVKSYFGMKSVSVTPDRIIRINGKNIFQRLVLDQGFYPDGIYTAPTDAALKKTLKYPWGWALTVQGSMKRYSSPGFYTGPISLVISYGKNMQTGGLM